MEEKKKTHPALTMSKNRAEAWSKADDEAFMVYLRELADIYAGKHYDGDGVIDSYLLFKKFKEWEDEKKRELC